MENQAYEAGPRKLISRASGAAAGTVYQQGISFVSGLIIARVIGAADYGIFNLARNLFDVTGIMTRLGLEIGLQRYFGETNTARDRAARVVVLRRVRLLASMVALLPLAAVALGLGEILEADVYPYPHFGNVLLCLALALPFVTDIAVLGGAYRGTLRLAPSLVTECVLLPTIRLAAIVILFIAGWRLWAVVLGTTIGSIAASLFLALCARTDFRGDASGEAHPWVDALRVIGYSSVLAAAVLVTTLTSSMDMLMLGRFTTAQDLGEYSLVKTLLTLMGVFGIAFGQGLGAVVAERYFRGDLAGMMKVMSLTVRWVTLGTLPIFAIFFFWGAQVTRIFGPSFAVSQTVVSWLAASQFIFMVFSPSGWALSMTGRHFLELKILAAGLVIATLLCWFAVPAFGQLGAAVATCASMAIANLARVWFVRKSIGALPFSASTIAITVVGIGLAWGSDAVAAHLTSSPAAHAIFGIACFLLAYGVVTWTHLLNGAERSGINEAVRATARTLLSGGNQAILWARTGRLR